MTERMIRRTTAFVILLATLAMNVEVGFGLARDGEVHHESEAMAVVHADGAAGPQVDHGHEDRGTVSHASDEHETHEHGTCLDHCTHIHAPAVPAQAPRLGAVRITTLPPLTIHRHPGEGSFTPLFHPPRA